MTGVLIALVVLVVPYVVLNVRRVRRGRRWAFSVCQVAEEWEERDRARRLALRAAAGKSAGADEITNGGLSR